MFLNKCKYKVINVLWSKSYCFYSCIYALIQLSGHSPKTLSHTCKKCLTNCSNSALYLSLKHHTCNHCLSSASLGTHAPALISVSVISTSPNLARAGEYIPSTSPDKVLDAENAESPTPFSPLMSSWWHSEITKWSSFISQTDVWMLCKLSKPFYPVIVVKNICLYSKLWIWNRFFDVFKKRDEFSWNLKCKCI